jgi:hypothetical protein
MIYALTADAAHIEEENVFDAWLIKFDGYEDARFSRPDIDYHDFCGAPKILEFVGNLENAAWLDHIFTAPMPLPLVSKRMVRVLESVGPFRHRQIPAVIYSERIRHLLCGEEYWGRTWYQVTDPALMNNEFVILQPLEQIDCLDHDRTLVNGVPFPQSGEQYLGKDEASPLVLRPLEGGFPPVFFVPELVYPCFTEEAKQACDQAGLKGLWWRPQG